MLIDISKTLLPQFENRFGTVIHKEICLKPEDGVGKIILTDFPGKLSLYRFNFNLREPYVMESHNPAESEWYLLNVNLSKTIVRKEVNGALIDLQRYLPSGVLFYNPGIRVNSQTPKNRDFEICLIRFNRRFLEQYFDGLAGLLSPLEKSVIYEDLDPMSEKSLREALLTDSAMINRHASLLSFLGRFFAKLHQREPGIKSKGIHPEDLKGLFMAAALLRNPLSESLPGINFLAEAAGMSPTKFKSIFRQVFGTPPIRYHQKIRMEYAKTELMDGKRSAKEISYLLRYSHPSKFSAAFKKHFGLLPSEI